MCDVSRGTEGKLMELFEQSINQSADAFNMETFKKLQNTIQLKRTMRNVNQESYDSLFWLSIWYPYVISEAKDSFAENINATYDILDEKFANYEQLKEYIESVRNIVNEKQWSIVTN